MRLPALPILVLSIAACSHQPAPATWTKAHWGMMTSEVMDAVPELTPENGGRLASGAAAQLHADKAVVADATLPAEFYFLDSRLVQIMFGDSQYHDNAATVKAFDRLAAALRKQYGQETLGPSMDPAAGLAREYDWNHGDTDIILSATPVTASTSTYTLIYRRAAAK